MRMQGLGLEMLNDDANYAVFRTMWCITVYSIAVIEFNKFFGQKAG